MASESPELEVLVREPAEPGQARASDRPPLLFVHGICSGAWSFDRSWLGRAADRGYYSAALSLRGHGGSSGFGGLKPNSLGDYVQDVLATIAHMPVAPVLIGHSMGTLVVRRVAEQAELAGMVLLAPVPAHGAWLSAWKQVRDAPLALGRSVMTARTPERPDLLFHGLPEAEGMELIRQMGPESPLVMVRLLKPSHFSTPECPIAVFGADHDRLVGHWDVKRTAADVGVSPQWLQDTGHEMMLDASAIDSIDTILDWVDSNV